MWMVGKGEMMIKPIVQLIPINVKEASQAEYAAMNQHSNRIRLERLPDDPPIPVEETIGNMQSLPPFVDPRLWIVWNPQQSEIIGQGNLVLLRLDENQHLAQFEITILPEFRRKGLGRRFLELIVSTAQQDNRRLLMTSTVDRVPGGEAFMRRIGANKGLEAHTNQLRIANLDVSLIKDWLVRGQANLAEFELGFWDGPYPDEKIQAVVDLFELTNQQPMGDLEIEDMHMTADQLRQVEKNIFANGSQRWTFYLVHRATGKFAGYSETVWNPNRPEILRQDLTGVFPEYRNKGLGLWLKAAMLDKVVRERPQVKFIRTGNADSNAAMLKINQKIGFKPYMAETLWQVEIQKAIEYLHKSQTI
jgi:mycothiol synthase